MYVEYLVLTFLKVPTFTEGKTDENSLASKNIQYVYCCYTYMIVFGQNMKVQEN